MGSARGTHVIPLLSVVGEAAKRRGQQGDSMSEKGTLVGAVRLIRAHGIADRVMRMAAGVEETHWGNGQKGACSPQGAHAGV